MLYVHIGAMNDAKTYAIRNVLDVTDYYRWQRYRGDKRLRRPSWRTLTFAQ